MEPFKPILGVLAKPQRALWDELVATPPYFVLYGGTALAIRLGHRQSQDFDFFATHAFVPDELLRSISYLRGAKIVQTATSTLTAVVSRDGPVQLSFFGGLGLRRIGDPDISPGNRVQVAALLDLAGCKAEVVQQRAEVKDYRDIAALLLAGVGLETILAAGQAVYGSRFDTNRTLRALTFFEDGNLPELALDTQRLLRSAVSGVDVKRLPTLTSHQRLSAIIGER